MNDNMMALLDREPKDGLEYFRGAMQKLLAPYPGSYDLLKEVVLTFYIFYKTEALPMPEQAEVEGLYLFVTGRDARSYEEEACWAATEKALDLLIAPNTETAECWNSFGVEMEDAWTQRT